MLFLIGCLAVLALAALLLGRLAPLGQFGTRAAARLETGRTIPTLWGLAADLLVFLAAAVLFRTHALALLGAIVLFLGFAIASLGLAAAALSIGVQLTEAFNSLETDSFGALRLGLWALVLAAGIPFAGWFLVLLATASGIGAVLDILFARPRPPSIR